MPRDSYFRWLLIVALAIIVVNLFGASTSHAQSIETMRLRNAWVTSDWSQGSGVIYKKDSVLTAAHVLGTNMKVNGKVAKVISIDTVHDLMTLGTTTDSVPTFHLDLVVTPLKSVITVGNPLGKLNFITLGYINWTDGEVINTSNVAMSGNSGAGAYDTAGALLGIVQSGAGNCTFGYTVNQLVSARRVLEFFLNPPTTNADSVLAVRAIERTQQGRSACVRKPP